jgi:hypothetical protein
METSMQPAVPNPLARLADSVPAGAALAITVAARLVGAAAAIYYAYDQDTIFPERHFPRTWVFVVVISAVALLSAVPTLRPRAHLVWRLVAAAGAGALVFGGANLAQRPSGVVVLIAGIAAWLSYAALAYQRERSPERAIYGLALGLLLSVLTIGICVVLVPN